MRPLTVAAIPVFIASMLVEAAWARRRGTPAYEARDTRTNIVMGLGSVAFAALYTGLFLPLMELAYAHRLWDLGHGAGAWLAALLGHDFAYYWAHRLDHERALFWAAHVTHHSSERLNLSTAVRQSWTQPLANRWFYLPLPLLGVDPLLVAAADGISALYQFFIHTEVVGRLGVLERVLNTPSHHRVHHACNGPYLDKNHGGILIVWDRLFGTFAAERPDLPVRYGLVKPMRSHNPLRVAFHGFAEVGRAVWRTRSLRPLLARP